MWNPKYRSVLLWGPLAWFIGVSYWIRHLRKNQELSAFQARERLLLEQIPVENDNQVAENPTNDLNIRLPRAESLDQWADIQPLLISTLRILRLITFCLWVSNLVSIEIADLYCEGHTVFSYLLTKLADIATRHEYFNVARNLLQLSMSWNSVWTLGPIISPRNTKAITSLGVASKTALELSKISDPVAVNLEQLALLAARTGQHGRFKAYSAMLAQRRFSIVKEGSKLSLTKLKTRINDIIVPVKEFINPFVGK